MVAVQKGRKKQWHLLRMCNKCNRTLNIHCYVEDDGSQHYALKVFPKQQLNLVLFLECTESAEQFKLQVDGADLDVRAEPGSLPVSLRPIGSLSAWFRIYRRISRLLPDWRCLGNSAVFTQALRSTFLLSAAQRHKVIRQYSATFNHYAIDCDYQNWIDNQEPGLRKSWLQNHPLPEKRSSAVPVTFFIWCRDDTFLQVLTSLRSIYAQKITGWNCFVFTTSAMQRDSLQGDLDLEFSGAHNVSAIEMPTSDNEDPEGLGGVLPELNSAVWVMFLEAGDRLAPCAFDYIERGIQHNAHASLVVVDEDRITSDGKRLKPVFKSAWNQDAFFSGQGLGRGVLFKMELLRGGQLSDIRLPDPAILTHQLLTQAGLSVDLHEYALHIPLIALHTCDSDRNPVSGEVIKESAKRYLTQYGGVNAHTDAVEVCHESPDVVRINWPLPVPEPMVSIIIPTRDHAEVLRPCVESILARTDYPLFEIIIVDNKSTCPNALEFLEKICARDPRVRVFKWDAAFNFSGINNVAVHHAKGRLVALVNNDIEPLHADWLTAMVRHACREEIGCVGAKLTYPDGRIQHAGVFLGIGGIAGHGDRFAEGNAYGYRQRMLRTQNVSAVTAACLVVRKTVYQEVGGMNERFLPVKYNDVDLCLKVQALGLRNVWTPDAHLIHHESVSRGSDISRAQRSRARKETAYMRKMWGDVLDADPYYNRNFSRVYEDFSLAAAEM